MCLALLVEGAQVRHVAFDMTAAVVLALHFDPPKGIDGHGPLHFRGFLEGVGLDVLLIAVLGVAQALKSRVEHDSVRDRRRCIDHLLAWPFLAFEEFPNFRREGIAFQTFGDHDFEELSAPVPDDDILVERVRLDATVVEHVLQDVATDEQMQQRQVRRATPAKRLDLLADQVLALLELLRDLGGRGQLARFNDGLGLHTQRNRSAAGWHEGGQQLGRQVEYSTVPE